MAVDRERVVEPHHHPVSGEVLERAAMRDDELAHRLLVLAQHPEDLLRLRRLGEGGEPAEIEEGDRDLAAVPLEHLGALLARDERRDLRREEPRELLPLALDGLEEIEVRDGDRRLVRERAHELDLVVGERLHLGVGERDDAQHLLVAD